MWCDGLVPVRLPERAWAEVPNLWAREMYRMASGVRLAFATTATAFEVDFRASVLVMQGGLLAGAPVVFDLFVDGEDHGAHEVAEVGARVLDVAREPVVVSETAAPPATLRFADLPPSMKTVELWLPANAVVELTGFRADADVRPLEASRRWIHHGSSVSHGRELRRPTLTWPAVAARLAGLDLVNLGVGGNAHLDPFVARAIRDAPADAISLKVGMNIAMDATFTRRTFAPALHGFLDTVRDGHPDVPIFAISSTVSPLLEDAAGPIGVDDAGELTARAVADDWPLLSLRRIREIMRAVVAERADPSLFYVDGLELLGAEDLADGFHPSESGHQRMGERFAEIMGGPAEARKRSGQ
jgi:lysophospholipase L1-like esterase